jgi:hypothetical protein
VPYRQGCREKDYLKLIASRQHQFANPAGVGCIPMNNNETSLSQLMTSADRSELRQTSLIF